MSKMTDPLPKNLIAPPARQTPNPKDGGYNDYATGVSQTPPGSKKK